MSRMTSALRVEDAVPVVSEPIVPANEHSAPRWEDHLLIEMGKLTKAELDELEDELNFYAFTGMAGPRLKQFLPIIDPFDSSR